VKKPIKYLQFENDLEILLRYFHDRKIQPSNWLKIPANKYQVLSKTQSKCQINISCTGNSVFPLDKTEVPPLVVASFDIEADSSHGDFPITKKGL
jgi:DNA polymerase elongation subunit (family B)